jgi:hypothetical protein
LGKERVYETDNCMKTVTFLIVLLISLAGTLGTLTATFFYSFALVVSGENAGNRDILSSNKLAPSVPSIRELAPRITFTGEKVSSRFCGMDEKGECHLIEYAQVSYPFKS